MQVRCAFEKYTVINDQYSSNRTSHSSWYRKTEEQIDLHKKGHVQPFYTIIMIKFMPINRQYNKNIKKWMAPSNICKYASSITQGGMKVAFSL